MPKQTANTERKHYVFLTNDAYSYWQDPHLIAIITEVSCSHHPTQTFSAANLDFPCLV